MTPETSTLSISITIACILAAGISILASYRLMKPLPLKISAKSTARPLSGLWLLSSAVAWSLLGVNADNTSQNTASQMVSFEEIESLPTTAAGIPASFDEVSLSATPLSEAKAVTKAEELAEEPKSADFQKLRNHITNMLFTAEGFQASESAIIIDLSQDSHKDMIKYLADERPGLLTIVYHKQFSTGPQMVVYFPEIAGNQLIYTPLTGPASKATPADVSAN